MILRAAASATKQHCCALIRPMGSTFASTWQINYVGAELKLSKINYAYC